MNNTTTRSNAGAQFEKRPLLRPRWLHPVSTASVVGIFVAFFASGIYWPQTPIVDLGGIGADLIPEGVSLEAGDPAPEGDSLEDPLPFEEASLTDEGMDELIDDEPPPPLIMEPDEIQAPRERAGAEKAKGREAQDREVQASRAKTPGATSGGCKRRPPRRPDRSALWAPRRNRPRRRAGRASPGDTDCPEGAAMVRAAPRRPVWPRSRRRSAAIRPLRRASDRDQSSSLSM